jgi:hypothetical protein
MLKTISKKSIQSSQNHMPVNFIPDVIKMSIKEDEENFYLTEDSYDYIKEKYEKPIEEGVGTELKKLLSKIGIRSTPNCSCNHKAKLMNMNGVEWCENNIDTILVWLSEEAKKRKLPFIKYGAKLIIKRAISNTKRNSNEK